MRIKTIILILLISCFLIGNTYSQSQQITPVSPEAAALAKMVNYPVNYNTGVPDISIPLYQIETGGMKLPITLNYHAGGFKIHERATSVGLGWSLSSDIQITRTINGLDDFSAGGYINNTKVKAYSSSCGDCRYKFELGDYPGQNTFELASGGADGMPDKFNYKLLNKSGSFFFMKNASGTVDRIVPVPYDDIKITFNDGEFIIVDTDGTTYHFGAQGPIDQNSTASMATEISGSSFSTLSRTAFKCTTIENATKTETIEFTYVAKSPVKFLNRTESIEYYNNASPCGIHNYFYLNRSLESYDSYEGLLAAHQFYELTSPKYIENFAYGKSLFHLPYLDQSHNVIDKTLPITEPNNLSGIAVYGIALSKISFKGGAVLFNGTDKINSIRVENDAHQELKTYALFQSYATPGNTDFAKFTNGLTFNGTPYLDSVQFKVGSTSYESYKVMYNNKFCFGAHIQGKDAWGYANRNTKERYSGDTYTSIPQQKIKQTYVDQPCSGYIENVNFIFGSNSFDTELTDAAVKNGIIKRLIYPTGGYVDFDFESNMYTQAVATDAAIVAMAGGLRVKSINYFDGKAILPTSQKFYRYGEFEDGIGKMFSFPPREFNKDSYNLKAYSYEQNIEYAGSYSFGAVSEKKTTFLPSSSIDYTYSNGAPIYYTKVTEYNQDLGEMSGKKVYTYYPPDFFEPMSTYGGKVPGSDINLLHTDGFIGAAKSIEDYKYEQGKYSLVHSKAFEYFKYVKDEQVRVAIGFFKTIFKIVGSVTADPYTLAGTEPYGLGEYGLKVGKLLVNAETEKWTKGADTISKITTYEYGNPSYTQPTKISTATSSGNRSKIFKYAYDFPGVPVYDEMTLKNMISPVIEEVDYNGVLEIARTKTHFDFMNSAAFIAPASIQQSKGGNALETVKSFDVYDTHANVLQVTEKNKVVKSYLWGYNYKYPIAEINGVNYVTATAGINTTRLHTLTNNFDIKATIDSVRLLAANSLVSSFTYQPLIGVLTETAPNGKSKYYEYDPYGRLRTIKNDSLQVISRYDYKMSGPTSGYATNQYYVNTPLAFTFNKTCPGSVIKAVNVVQAGGAYGSYTLESANDEAERALLTDGNYLAANADCNAPDATVTIGLARYLISGPNIKYPTKVYLDFIQDKSVVYTASFPFSTNFSNIHIPAGDYKIAIRFDENYNGSLFQVYVEENLTRVAVLLASGQALSLTPGSEYSFVLSNNPTPISH